MSCHCWCFIWQELEQQFLDLTQLSQQGRPHDFEGTRRDFKTGDGRILMSFGYGVCGSFRAVEMKSQFSTVFPSSESV